MKVEFEICPSLLFGIAWDKDENAKALLLMIGCFAITFIRKKK